MNIEINTANENRAIAACLTLATGLIVKKIKEYRQIKRENIVADVEGKIIEEDV